MKKTKEKPLALIVEDSAVEAEIIKRSVARGGYEVAIARNGFDGLEFMMARKPAIVLSDINMPQMNGFEMCAAIREKKELRDVPVMLISALSDPEDVIMAITAGADGYITKPYDEDALLSRIEALICAPRERKGETDETMDIEYKGKLFTIPINYRQQMNILLSVYENLISQNHQLTNVQVQLAMLNERLEKKVAERTATLAKEIEDRVKAAEVLRKSQNALSNAQKLAHLGDWELDIQTGKGTWSDESYRIFGLTPGAFEPTFDKFMGFIHPEDRKTIEGYFPEILSGSLSQAEFDIRIIRADGEERVVHDKLEVVTDEAGKPVKIIGVNFDITERKRAEAELAESESKYRSLFANMRNGFAYCKMIFDENNQPVDWIYLEVNDAFERVIGLKKETVEGKRVTEVFPTIKDFRPNLFEIYGQVALTGVGTEFTVNFDISAVWLSISVYCPQPGYFAAVFDDITERKRAEEILRVTQTELKAQNNELRQTQEELEAASAKYLNLYDFAPIGYFTISEQGLVLEANLTAANLLGMTRNHLIAQPFARFIVPEDQDIYYLFNRQPFEKGKSRVCKLRMTRQDGVLFWARLEFTVAEDAKAECARWYAVMSDVTRQVQVENALQESEARHRAVMETANDAMICINPDGKVHMWNRKAEEMFGYTAQEASGKDVHDLIVPVKYLEQARVGLAKFGTTGAGPVINKTTEITALRRDGSEFPIELSLATVKMKDGWGASAIIRDITERKALIVRQERLNRALRMLSSCNQELIQARDEKQLLDNICRVITEVGGYRMAWIGFAEQDEAKTVKPVASSGYDEGYVEMLNITWADTEKGQNPIGEAIHSGRPVIARISAAGATSNLGGGGAMEATKRGYASLASLPLADGEAVMGALNIYSEDPNAFDAEEIQLLTELANDLSFGIIHLRMQKTHESLQRDLAEAHRIAHIGSYVWDAKSDTSHWCDEMYNIFGIRRGEITPSLKAVSEMTHPDDRASVVEKVRIAMEETGQYESEYRIVRPDGSVRHVHSQGESRRNEKGEPVGLIGTLTDITAQKEWEITLMETNQRLQQALDDVNKTQKMLIRSEKLAALGQLSAGVAHEIKNPLNIIYTSTQLMMMEEGVSGEVAESGKIIMEQVMRAVKIIDNLREFARERKSERKAIDLCPFIEKTMGLVAYEMKGEGIEVGMNCLPKTSKIMGDEDQLAQVFLNITNNARDSMNTRRNSSSFEERERIGWKARLTVQAREEDGKAKISFEDNGVGISEENKRKLFTPFFTTKGESKGTGLGIAIAFGIIENHGGAIEFESEEGKGAIFTVTLPLAG